MMAMPPDELTLRSETCSLRGLETVANATQKPLFTVSVADVGLQPNDVERNLSKLFSLAARWKAVLLL